MFFQEKHQVDYLNSHRPKRRLFASRVFFAAKTKKKFLNISLSLLTIFSLVGGIYFSSDQAQGVDFTFTQTDWSGEATPNTATHTDDQTGWTEFSAKDQAMAAVNGGADLQLDLPNLQEAFTSDADFSTGTDSDTEVLGAGNEAMIKLLNYNEVVQVSTGNYHTCALKTDGTVFCWGLNNAGQLGDNTTVQKTTPVQVHGVDNSGFLTNISRITTGSYHTCALKTDGSVFCWGLNSSGQLGDNTTVQKNTPVQVSGIDNVGYISTGGNFSCAVKSDNTAYCWGANSFGQLGDNTTVQKTTPVQVHGVDDIGFLTGVNRVATGVNQACALKTDGTVFCWGNNSYGQLGDNTTVQKTTPVQVHGVNDSGLLTDIKQIESGQNHVCSLKADGTAYCWGYNGTGQLGDNTTVQKSTPVQVHGVNDSGFLTGIDQIASTTYRHVCAVKTDGSVFCWGYGVYGQLGNHLNTTSRIPVQVDGVEGVGFLTGIDQVSIGYYHTCSVDIEGNVSCWGYNGNGQLGDGTTTQVNVPVQTLNIMTYQSSGTYTSSVADLSEAKNFTILDFTKTVPANTALTVDVRAGNTADPDGSWTAWQNDITDEGDISSLNGNRYVQYRTNLSTSDISVTPSLADITFRFSAIQTLTSSPYDTEVAGANLSKIQWSETLPANTDIQFQLRTSADNVTWGPWCGPDAGVGCDSDAYFTDPTGESEAIDDTQRDKIDDRYFQYQATLSSTDGIDTPTLNGVTVSYATVNAPTVTTIADPTVTSFSATASGNITATGGENPTRYIQWGTASGVYPNQCSADTGPAGVYSCDISSLTPDTTYYYRAKATNSAGEAYGGELSFTTLPEAVIIPEPDEAKIIDAESSDYFTIGTGTVDSTDQATANLNITLTTGNGQAYFPLGTVITNTDGGTFDLSQLDVTDVTTSVRSTVPTSRGAIEIGVPNTRLTFTNNPITISIAVNPVYNGDSLDIQSKSAGSSVWVDEGSCIVTDGDCSFTTTHATTYSVNGDGTISGETNINSSLPIEATISITCTDSIAMNPITGTGQSAIDAANEATCNVKTNNSQGYKLEWSAPQENLTNLNSDTINPYQPATPDTPELWAIDQATSAWGARLKSTSTDADTNLWGTSDGYAGKWLDVSTVPYQIVLRSTETLQTGSDETIQFGSEIGSNKFQPTGTYSTGVVMTATTL